MLRSVAILGHRGRGVKSPHRLRPMLLNLAVATLLATAGVVYGLGPLFPGIASAIAPPPVNCTTSEAAIGTFAVGIQDFSFNPGMITIGINESIKWTNHGVQPHTVTANDFTSDDLATDAVFTCTFNQAGTFAYHCAIHAFMTGSVVVRGPAGTTTSTTTSSTQASPPPKVPRGIIAYVPIVIHNSQEITTPVSYNQQVIVNSSKFAGLERSDLHNIKFFTKSGSAIYSWMEQSWDKQHQRKSGELNTSSGTVYWLKMPVRIPAHSDLTIFMGFATTSTDLFNTKTTGEAPELSAVYGKFDNGALVFKLYDRFKLGSSNALWNTNLTAGGSFVRNNSLTIHFGGAPGYFVTKRTFGVGSAFDTKIISFGNQNNVGFFRTIPALHNAGNGNPNWGGSFIRSNCLRVYPDQWNKTGEANPCGNVNGYFNNGTAGGPGIYSVHILTPKTSIQSIDYVAGNTTQPIGISYPAYPARAGFTNQNSSLASQWARVRVGPSNGVMPSVTFGALHLTITIASGAANPINSQFYVPSVVTIPFGSVVTWVNKDSLAHTVTSNSDFFFSGSIVPKGSFTFTFAESANQQIIYYYHCGFHPWMQGKIIVVSG